MVVAPATKYFVENGKWNVIIYLVPPSSKSPVYFAPAMDLDMYIHPSTINTLML
jgi:phosphopantothenoylcysteine decarboxylase/phosphopantothenate--cysteine ligase